MRAWLLVALTLVAAGCGSSSSTTPTPVPTVPTFTAPSDPRFDLAFYRQLAQNTFDAPSQPVALQRLTQSPSIYLQRTGLSDAFVAQLQQTARDVIPAFTGGAISLASWETGTELRPDAPGWIVVELRTDDNANCGLANVGRAAGHIWINTAAKCARRGQPVGTPALFAHEIGHALGFYHIDSGLMQYSAPLDQQITDRERYHGAVAYQQPIGSLAN